MLLKCLKFTVILLLFLMADNGKLTISQANHINYPALIHVQ
jgi:hypothetical protein